MGSETVAAHPFPPASLAAIPVAALLADADGRTLSLNPAAERLVGWTSGELAGQSLSLLFPAQDAAHAGRSGCDLLCALSDGQPRELALRTRDGRTLAVEVCVGPALAPADGSGADGQTRHLVIVRDISETKHVEEALRAARHQAEIANRSKTEFLATMSHELRTPLNAIIGFSEILKEQMFGTLAPRYVDYAQTIFESGQHLLKIINDVLEMARIEAGRYELAEQEVRIADVVDSCLFLIRARAAVSRIGLDRRLPDDLPLLWADRRALLQVMNNLLQNAVKFSRIGGAITVSSTVTAAGEVAVMVVDQGIGIPPEDLNRLTRPFQQSQAPLNRSFEGAGLGLAITKNLVGMHGGTMEIDSTVGVGTTVTLTFPLSRVVSRSEPPRSNLSPPASALAG